MIIMAISNLTVAVCATAGGKLPGDVTEALWEAQQVHEAAKAALHAQHNAAIQAASVSQSSTAAGFDAPTSGPDSQATPQSALPDTHNGPGALNASDDMPSANAEAILPKTSGIHGSHRQVEAAEVAALQPIPGHKDFSLSLVKDQQQSASEDPASSSQCHDEMLQPGHHNKEDAPHGRNSTMQKDADECKMGALHEQQVQHIKQSAAIISEEAEVLVSDLFDYRQVP